MSALQAKVVGALRRLGTRPRLLPLLALYLAAPTVRRPFAYLLRETLGPKATAAYRLRENGLTVWIRHKGNDVVILGELFNRHYYEPPAEIESAIAPITSVLDLGANIGMFGAFAAGRWPQAKIVAFEPDPDNAAVQRRTIASNDLGERWTLVESAAGNHDGQMSFVAGLAASSHAAELDGDEPTIKVPVTDVLAQISAADLLKMDIEGGEWAILGDPRFRAAPPRAVVLEYHDRMCPGSDSRGAAESALRAAGLEVLVISDRDDGQGMLWAWRA